MIAQRLRELRVRAGLSVRAVAEHLDYSHGSGYQRYENPDVFTKEVLPFDMVGKLIKLFVGKGLPPITAGEVWTLAGRAGTGMAEAEPVEEVALTEMPRGYFAVPVADARAGMGGPGAIMSEQPIAYRYFPEEELRAMRVKPENLWAHRADGDSMAPDFQDGDLLIIDTSQKNPTPPRIFTIWDGFGLVTKYVERVIGADPPRVRLIASNPKFPMQELTIGDRGELDGEEAFIVGRVVFVQRAL
jgi:phage repressor protein C with HTH and peptisase S24 domain